MAQVFVSIGSNIDRELNIRSGVDELYRCYGELLLSSVYDSQAVGFTGANFYNLVAGFDTGESVSDVVARLRDIEDAHHRDRDGERFSSRTLDIDLLLFDDLIIEKGGLKLPRDEIITSAFVLGPLAEIAGHLVHPLTGRTFRILWQEFDQASQPMQRIEFEWHHGKREVQG